MPVPPVLSEEQRAIFPTNKIFQIMRTAGGIRELGFPLLGKQSHDRLIMILHD